jgi:drug/metabolite transporter (DMT)-like permease
MKMAYSKWRLIFAFGLVYVVWGSTYLAIRIAIETLPSFLMAGTRFTVAGLILFAFARRNEKVKIQAVHWRSAFIVGALLLAGGNGGVVWAEHWVPSGITALIIATVPLWTVFLEIVWNKNNKIDFRTLSGIFLGFAGLWYLIRPAENASNIYLPGALVLLTAALSWSIGSIYARRAPLPKTDLLPTAMEMIGGGSILLMLGTFSGEWLQVRPEAFSLRSVMALLFLIVFGALVGFTAYKYILKHTSPTLSATYAYVNPVIAVFLGWFVLGEPLSPRLFTGAAIILAGVFLITIGSRKNIAA